MATGWSPGCERGGNTTLGSAYCSATTWNHQEFNQIQIKKTGFAPISRRDGNKIYQLGSFHMPPSFPKISEKCWSHKTVHSGFLSCNSCLCYSIAPHTLQKHPACHLYSETQFTKSECRNGQISIITLIKVLFSRLGFFSNSILRLSVFICELVIIQVNLHKKQF